MKLSALWSLRQGSLQRRLLLGTLAWIAVAIAVAGWGLRGLFQEHVDLQLQDQLVRQIDQLSAAVNLNAAGTVEVTPMADDARLSTPLSGLYWQVDVLPAAGPVRAGVARSRSLWDQELPLPGDPAWPAIVRGNHAVDRLTDTQGRALLVVSRRLRLPEANAPVLRLSVAADHALMDEPVQRFTRMLLAALLTLAAGLALAAAVQLRLALRPLDLLRRRLASVRTGEATRLEGQFPNELQPLVSEFNHVLGVNAEIVQRARTQAGNLAHALHTPLSILGNAAAREDTALARLVREQTSLAQRQVDHQLAHARASAAVRATGLRAPVHAPMQALLRTVQRLHAGRGVHFSLDAPDAGLAFRGEEQDLFEMLGNLLDNAGKWARSQVRLAVQPQGVQLCFTVDDDGPGIPEAQRERIFARGQRLDEKRPGTGLGLDIVRELAHAYGGDIQAETAPLGGLRMRLCLPAAEV